MMNVTLISAALALSANAEQPQAKAVDSDTAGQTVQIISLKSAKGSGTKSAGSATQIYLMPPSPPLVAFVQEDGSIVYRHSAQHMKPVTDQQPVRSEPQ